MPNSTMRVSRKWFSLLLLPALGGCTSGQFFDPNDPTFGSVASPRQLQIAVAGIYDNLEFRRANREISREFLQQELVRRTSKFAKTIDLSGVAPEDAWRVGEVLRTALMWKDAERMYATAARVARTTDRRVNDTLRHAQCLAALGKVAEAVKQARSVMDVGPEDKAPILPAVLLEIVPAGRGKGSDKALADLLVAAMDQHFQTRVDPATEPGKAFLVARKYHIRNSIELASRLYRAAGQPKLAATIERDYYARLRAIQ